ncbi:flagellum-specific peptidoglycan hydrolase FlgJ [Brevibacillus aydinogluensis]|uniref:glycoside hydrolase family 73 protein n=1 Tax=Brevibacillus aydinogluensis TaxID=927786 RepID=UPI002892BCD6|nr:glycoside hydrolase family 73 protein [Brevibacillus aydinogluensis]MDT3416190.1 flagellum-specific peptidoglycan hydrolase FlgJ [Brevibacillus aydinogluensis]
MTQQEFIDKIAPAAVEDMRKTRIPASLTIAQAILESNWGKSGLTKQANNLFGIKGTGPAGSVTMPTTEYVNGKPVKVNANFRKYNSWAESIADHSALILNGTRDKPTRYHGVLGADYKKACQEIWKGGYATDPAYPQKLISLIEQYNLQKYDRVDKCVDNPVDRESAEEVIAILGAVYMAADNDPGVRAAAHYAADALRDAAGIPKP